MQMPFFNIGLYLTALVALVDQGSKWWVLTNVFQETRLERINGFLNLRLSWNKGVTFGLFNNFAEWMPYILIVTTLVIMVLLMNWLRKAENLLASLGLGLIMGGALGNVIDRFRHGAVVDFIDLHAMDYHWYTFNLADSAIVCGVGLLLLENLIVQHPKKS